MSEEVQATANEVEDSDVSPVVEGNTNDSINASLDDIDDPVVLKKMLKKVRGEAARNRVEKNDVAAKLKEYEDWKDSQRSELEKANKRAEEAEAKVLETLKKSIAKEFDIDEDLQEFLVGSTEDEIRAKAQKLGGRKSSSDTQDDQKGSGALPAGTTLRPGTRGTPVGKAKTAQDEGADFFAGLWDNTFKR